MDRSGPDGFGSHFGTGDPAVMGSLGARSHGGSHRNGMDTGKRSLEREDREL